MSDELEKAKANERQRTQRLWMAAGLGGLGLTALPCSILLWDTGWPLAEPLALVLAFAGVGVVVASFAWGGRYMPNGDTIRLENARGGYRDSVQSKRASWGAYAPLMYLFPTWKSMESAWMITAGRAEGLHWMMVGLGPLCAVTVLLVVAGLDNPGDKKMKRLLEDELTLSFRRDALNVALAVAMIGLLVVFGLGLWRPEAAVAALPGLMFVTASAAGLRYWQLDRRASGG